MLVLSRKVGESIRIGNDIVVSVVAVEGDQIKLGIKAPRNVDIHRTEIYEQILQANREAVQTKNTINLLKNLKND
ncbi:carbon storage regulator CsrA [Bacillaceae bacterium W0354]